MRITVQLIEAGTGNPIWAERYDRELEDIVAVQDEVTCSIVGVLPGRVQVDVAERASRKRPDNMRAYEFLLKGKAVRDSFSAEDTLLARSLFEKAIELDPRYAKAHAYLADTYFIDLMLGLGTPEGAEVSLHHARQAMNLDSEDIANHDQLGFADACLAGAYANLGRAEEATRALDAFKALRRQEFESRNIPLQVESLAILADGYRPMWRKEDDWALLAGGLVKAGLEA